MKVLFGLFAMLSIFMCTGLSAQGTQYTAKYHVIIPNEGEVRMEEIYTNYLVTDNSVYYADKTTHKRMKLLLKADKVNQFPSIVDYLQVQEYDAGDRGIIVFTQYETNKLEYLVYAGLKGMYFAIGDKELAESMFANIKKQRGEPKRYAWRNIKL